MLGWPTALAQQHRDLLQWFNDAGRTWPSMRSLFDPAPAHRDALALAAFSGVALSEDGASYLVSLEVPGIELDDLSVTVQGNALVVEGHAGQTCEYSDDNGYRLLRRVGAISRRVQLPPDANANRVEASINDGELTVIIARS
ncbi:MAG: Hsp20/alpha crystallin family protein [Gammaproteobacteria bacterium]|nr:Hsp20/alpha crystallin family protein [Gammaproteobacteria bacterium]